MKIREEAVNENMAFLLEKQLKYASAEQLIKSSRGSTRKSPDIRITIDDVRIILEARFSSNALLADTKQRIVDDLCEIAIAIIYPPNIKSIVSPQKRLDALISSDFKVSIFYKGYSATSPIMMIPEQTLSFSSLVANIIDTVELTRSQSNINESVSAFTLGLHEASSDLTAREERALPGFRGKINRFLQISDQTVFDNKDYYYLAYFILSNTMVFHQHLANRYNNIPNLVIGNEGNYIKFLSDAWGKILQIDYRPIFDLSLNLLSAMPVDRRTSKKLKKMSDIATAIVTEGSSSKHDFMGRIFTNFLLRSNQLRDQYAAFYTSSVAADLMTRLTIDQEYFGLNNCNDITDKLSKFRVLDPFSGSGTLLSASYQQIYRNLVHSGANYDDLEKHQTSLIENVLHGWDVLPFASYLCLLTLALHSRLLTFNRSNIYTVKIGPDSTGLMRLGSYEEIVPASSQTTFPAIDFNQQRTMHGMDSTELLSGLYKGPFDIVIMNPPYKRSSGGGSAYSFLPQAERRRYQNKISELCDKLSLPPETRNVTYSLALQLGHLLLKDKGRVAFILPKTFLSGVSSAHFRNLFITEYWIKYILMNSDPGTTGKNDSWNWSEDTDLSEIIFIAEKSGSGGERYTPTVLVNFRKKPSNIIDSARIADKINGISIENTSSFKDVQDQDNNKIHLSILARDNNLKANMARYSVFSSSFINGLLDKLLSETDHSLALRPLFEDYLILRGMGTKEVNNLLDNSKRRTPFPVKWGHQINDDKIPLLPGNYGYGLPKGKVSQDQVTKQYEIWSGKLMFSNRPQIKTKKLLVLMSDENLLSTAFWSCRPKDGVKDIDIKKIVLFLNSSIGMVLSLSAMLHKKGELFEFKKNQEKMFLVPPMDIINDSQTTSTWSAIEQLSFDVYANDFKNFSSGNVSAKSPRYMIDRLFIDTLYSENQLGTLYAELNDDPIFR